LASAYTPLNRLYAVFFTQVMHEQYFAVKSCMLSYMHAIEGRKITVVPAWVAAAEATMMPETWQARRQSRPRCNRLRGRSLHVIVPPGMKYKYATGRER